MTEEPHRVSDAMLSDFMVEQRQIHLLNGKRLDSLETSVIGPPVLGTTGAPILNGDGLPVRDEKKGLARKRNWPQILVQTSLQFLGLATAVIVLINTLGS